VRGDNAREAAERFVVEDEDLCGRIVIGDVPVDLALGTDADVTALVCQLRRAVEELIRERDEEAAEAAGLVLRDRRRRADR
jgi:hypothetical protein